jgi:hypothetical protein
VVVSEAGGEGFVEGAIYGQQFSVAIRASAIDDSEDYEECIVLFITIEPYIDVAGVPYDASDECVARYGALPGVAMMGQEHSALFTGHHVSTSQVLETISKVVAVVIKLL